MTDVTKDIRRLGDVCCMVGYLGASVDKLWANTYSDTIVEYINDLFVTNMENHDKKEAKGRWIHEVDDDMLFGGEAYVCSDCGYGYGTKMHFEPQTWKYCPNCGKPKEVHEE